jgi:pseudouridine-5'-phosphate glycosidase
MIDIRPEVARAILDRAPIVALETTLIAHGLPWPVNLETARAAEAAVRAEGAVPATIAVWEGRPTIGLSDGQIERLAQEKGVIKASRRDLAPAIARRATAATTVAATMFLAHQARIRFLATGGIGGVHRRVEQTGDISADLVELSRTPVAVVCAGAKSILDLPRTLETLETLSVPVIGYRTNEFPAFYAHSSGEPVSGRVDSVEEARALLLAHWGLHGAGILIVQPVQQKLALTPAEIEAALTEGEESASATGIRGPALTPYLLKHLADATSGRSTKANQALVIANTRLAAQIARALASGRESGD